MLRIVQCRMRQLLTTVPCHAMSCGDAMVKLAEPARQTVLPWTIGASASLWALLALVNMRRMAHGRMAWGTCGGCGSQMIPVSLTCSI